MASDEQSKPSLLTVYPGTRTGRNFNDRYGPAAVSDAVGAPAITFLFFKLLFDERRPLDRDAYVKAHIDLALHGLLA